MNDKKKNNKVVNIKPPEEINSDLEGYRLYTSKMSDAEVIESFEFIKLIILSDKFED